MHLTGAWEENIIQSMIEEAHRRQLLDPATLLSGSRQRLQGVGVGAQLQFKGYRQAVLEDNTFRRWLAVTATQV